MIGFRCPACFVLVAIFGIGILSFGSTAHADPVAVELPPQPLASALREFARQTGIQVAVPAELTNGKTSAAVRGKFEPADALNKLLQGSGLIAYPVNRNTYGIRSETTANRAQGPSVRPIADAESPADQSLLAQGNTPPTYPSSTEAQSTSAPTKSAGETPSLTEIIVTAEKRSERLQDVPVPVTALSADALLDNNQLRLEDYYTSVPGLSFSMGPYGEPFVIIRGLTSNAYTTPTVGVTVDDLPYGASTGNASGYTVPDIDPSDLARVEVLRGPQGTLYGASSMGGLIKYVTLDPSMDEVSGRVQAGASNVSNSSEVGYSVRGSVNVPLSETLAVRASGFTRQDPGYVDNIQTGERGVNEGEASGGRLAALWRPSEFFSLKLGALVQDTKTDGSPDVNEGGLDQNLLRGTGEYHRNSQVYSANLMAKLGGVDLTSISGYSIDSFSSSLDFTPAFGTTAQSLYGVGGAAVPLSLRTTKFSQELRFAASIGQTVDWLLGGFFTHEDTPANQDIVAVDPATGAVAGAILLIPYRTTYEEYAAFADLTFHITDKFDVQIGGRESQNKQSYAQGEGGPLVGGTIVIPTEYSKDNAFTYLFTPRYKVSSDLMVYARLASGYRPGGPNANSQLVGVPRQVNPDTTENYEIGVKGDTWRHTLSFDASLYYIDWKSIQLSGMQDEFSFYFNGSRAKSQGLELSVESKPLSGLTIDAWVAFNDAKLTESFPAASVAAGVYGASGDRLPYGSRFSGNLSLEQDFPLAARWTGFVGGALSYVGDRLGDFQATAERQDLPAYAKLDLRAGAKYDSWTVNFFANNVANRRGVLQGDLTTVPPAFIYIPPRTIGFSVAKKW